MKTINVDGDSVGALPALWEQGVTGEGTARWAGRPDASAPSKPNVLQQSGSGAFPWCVLRKASVENGFVEVRFKTRSGKEDRAGGVVWRWKDGENYYVARANALEDNVSLYYTEKGRRITIKYVDAPVEPDVWHMLRVEFSGARIRVALNGKTYIDVEDAADSVTAFDDFSYGSL